MHIDVLVEDVLVIVERLRREHGEFKLAMLFNAALNLPTNWNLIVSSDWTDRIGIAESTREIAREIHQSLRPETRPAISRITVLKTTDSFVRDMTRLYPRPNREGGVPLSHLTAGNVEGAGFLLYSQPEIPA
jgi:hypothetical protein